VNGAGAVTTGIATIIIASTKFTHGAWIVFLLILVLVMMFRSIRSHYKAVSEQIALTRDHRPPLPRRNIVIVPINGVNRAVIRAVDYARSRAGEIRAVMVDVDPEATARIQIQWAQWGCGVNLIALPLLPICHGILARLHRRNSGKGTRHLGDRRDPGDSSRPLVAKHPAQPTRCSSRRPCFKDRVILTDVPFHLKR
jgi:hypothetical protein